MEPSLDQLIGDLRAEASRRRAAPDFPVEEEAAVAAGMDREGSRGGAVGLGEAAAALDALQPGLEGPLAELAALTASALRSLAVRIGELERHIARIPRTQPAAANASPVSLAHWIPAVSGASRGRVLVTGTGCAPWVTSMAEEGADVYGLDQSAEEYSEEGPVRSGSVAGHLRSVGSLGAVVVVGAVPAAEIDTWVPELRRATTAVLVVSETPWYWRLRAGPGEADMAGWRPLSAETWMELLTGAGFDVEVEYSRGGHDYCLTATTGS